MSMQTGDAIVAPSRGDAATAIDHGVAGNAARQDFMREYIQMVYALCAQAGTPDASIVIAQSVHETSDPGPWQSHWWRERGNPAGMGVTGDPQQNEASPWFATGEEAARAQVSHLILYATGTIAAAGLTPADDPRYDAYVEAYGHTAQATTIDGLTGKWGTDPQYATKVCQRGAQVYPNLPDQEEGGGDVADIVYGRVPMPSYTDRIVPTPPNTAWDDLGVRTIRAVVWHRMLGSLWGTDSWYRGGGAASALTDWGVGVAATDGGDEAGHLIRWNDPASRRSPWSSGPVSAPYGDGKKFVDLYGVNAVNRDTTALEISGDQQTPLDEKSRDMICRFTAYYADRYEVPWTDFPIITGENQRSVVIWHNEFTEGTGKECPFDVVRGETDALIARTKDVLKQYQTGGTAPEPPQPPETGYPAARIPVVPESQGFELVLTAGDHRYRCTHGGKFKTGPSRDAPDGTPSPYAQGQVYTLPYSTVVAEETWLVSKAGSWCLLKNFTESS